MRLIAKLNSERKNVFLEIELEVVQPIKDPTVGISGKVLNPPIIYLLLLFIVTVYIIVTADFIS